METNSQKSSLHWWWLSMIFFIINCKKSNEEKDYYSVSEPIDTSKVVFKDNVISDTILSNQDLEEFKEGVIKKGDNYSFTRLIIHFQEHNNYKELYNYAKTMADKYNKGDGYSQVFECIVAMNNDNLYRGINDFANIDEKYKLEALKYLERGAQLNDINSATMLQEIYRNGIGVKKDIKKADELKKKIEKYNNVYYK